MIASRLIGAIIGKCADFAKSHAVIIVRHSR
jgi:hypothetical protein